MIPKDCIPANESEMVCEITGGPSTDGKYEFALYWLTDYNPGGDSGATKVGDLFVRGQNFHCDMEWYMAQCFQKKLTWREVDRRNQPPKTEV